MERAEKFGLGAATAGHVVLFGLLSVGFLATPNPLKIERPPVEVTFADDVGLEATAPRNAEQPPATSVAPELGKPEPAPALPEPDTAPVPAPTPKPDKPPVRERAAVPEKAEPKRTPERPKGARLGPDFLKGITEAASVSRTTEASAANIGPRVQASLAAELKRQLKPHWRAPTGADIELLRVVVEARLAPDGSLLGEPRAQPVQGVNASNRAQAQLFAERAVSAVKQAAPFQLPKQYYSAWSLIKPQFDKRLSN
jgi:outer membrane biosynthesis protein TonB